MTEQETKTQTLEEKTKIVNSWSKDILFQMRMNDGTKKIINTFFSEVPQNSPIGKSLENYDQYRVFVPMGEGDLPSELYLLDLKNENLRITDYPPTILGRVEKIPFVWGEGYIRQDKSNHKEINITVCPVMR